MFGGRLLNFSASLLLSAGCIKSKQKVLYLRDGPAQTCCHSEIVTLAISVKERASWVMFVVGCLMYQQQASVSHGRIYFDKVACYYTEIEVADQTCYLTQSRYINAGPIAPGAWQAIAIAAPIFESLV